MPLDGVHIGVAYSFHGLYYPVLGAGSYAEPFAQILNGLMVVAVGPQLISVQPVEDWYNFHITKILKVHGIMVKSLTNSLPTTVGIISVQPYQWYAVIIILILVTVF